MYVNLKRIECNFRSKCLAFIVVRGCHFLGCDTGGSSLKMTKFNKGEGSKMSSLGLTYFLNGPLNIAGKLG